MRIKIYYIILLFTVFAPFSSFAQSENETLEGNLEYKGYKVQLDSLQKMQESIVEQIDKLKALSESDPDNKEQYVEKVLRLEGELFNVRSRVGVCSSKCSTIEQEFIIKNMGKKKSSAAAAAAAGKQNANTNLLLNKFFVDNVTADEMTHIKSRFDIDSLASVLRDSMSRQITVIRAMDEALRRTQDAAIADSLFAVAEASLDVVKECENKLAKVWKDMYDTKLYVYTRLLDKLNVSVSVLSKFSERSREIRSDKESAGEAKFSPIFYAYPFEHELIMSYEKVLAEKLVYLSALDSLSKKMDIVRTRRFDEMAIELPEWDYVDFTSAAIGGKGVHSSRNPIRKVAIPTHGAVYTLRITTLTNPVSQLTSFKNLNPVSVFQNELGKYEYHVGTYRTSEDAQHDIAVVRRAGFNPVVTEWRDGGKVTTGGDIVPVNVSDNSYRVEFESVTPEITARLKELAPGKELLRIDDKYSIGFFKNYLDAVKIQKAIGVECKIVPVELNL